MSNILVNAPKTAKRGAVVEIKALIMHPMETGFRPGPNGRIIPRNVPKTFVTSTIATRKSIFPASTFAMSSRSLTISNSS